MDARDATTGYEVPTYEAPPETVWYHFLHGNVPGHQIDFIFRPSVPQGVLTRQHFSHLARLVTYIEPRQESAYAFAIGNLSRDDTQYEPGHSGVAIVFGLRIKGALDYAGRQDPPFCHSVVCVDRNLDGAAIHDASVRFYERLLPDHESRTEGSGWYHSYVAAAQQKRESVLALIRSYLHDFDKLPAPGPSGLGLRWTVEGSEPPRRIVIVHPDGVSFEVLAGLAARIANVLLESDIRWTAISSGREQDLIGGTTVRLVPERDAVQEPAGVVFLHIDQVPLEPRDIAEQLFGAHEVRISQTQEVRLKWRHMMTQKDGASGGPAIVTSAPIATPETGLARPWTKQAESQSKKNEGASSVEPAVQPAAPERKKNQRRQFTVMVALGVAIAVCGLFVAAWLALTPAQVDKPVVPQASAVTAVPTVTTVPAPLPTESAVPVTPTATTSTAAPEPTATGSVMPSATTSATGTNKKTGTTTGGSVIGGKLW